MIERTMHDNLFDLPMNISEVAVFTTNGVVRKNGSAVCGAGIAKEADSRFHIAALLGRYISAYGNRPFNLGIYERGNAAFTLATFPTKYHWKDKSDLALIRQSAEYLQGMADKFAWTKIYLPPPGCGLGGLDYETEVKPVLEDILDNRFVIVRWLKKEDE